jgi:hypothetical protein
MPAPRIPKRVEIIAGIIAALLGAPEFGVYTVRRGLIVVAILVLAYVVALLVVGAGLPR